ncbi:MAG: hybrid sensor histidine kinase/response regulator [Microcoleus sp. PH2017_25_DOB_D_A]|nr:hybrid sensor histidine kinase/response regulator [Microcoleus sp. PH2017_02_FOX_O_A]MCC3435978.1 hybrid sensor histidine kinase/response regulator [Microcoleus sp. PH2017_05_CCC_O_A]MCC3441219.1 hybrid sensor histidine kinase/response regulator [Microcoleus sp. PH2017_03_ELD_O_A]MCC3448096.1 hybrid sensor histidine kinase/response regulator [Microcoleus sp. PH2017_09_SFU_O_A]MCC3467306.1 hybrid sensor histidine kinase/response regulator [Microcoleus sp. PH2017_06_SFM_O_A]MCC3474587.1 hybri
MSNFSMMDLFRMEADTQVAVLNENILVLENNPNSPAELESLMRAAHSLKGAARIVGLDAAVRIAHVMEDCFVAAQAGSIALDSPDKIDVMLRAIDLLAQISQIPETEIENWLPVNRSQIETLETAILAIINNEQLDLGSPDEAETIEQETIVETEILPEWEPQLPVDFTAEITDHVQFNSDIPHEILPDLPQVESPETRLLKTDLSMLALFAGEVEAQSILLNQTLLSLKNNPNEYLDLDSLVKSAHLIKGAGRIVQFHEVVKLAKAIEDTFVALQKHKSSLNASQIDTLLAGVNFLVNMQEIPVLKIEAWLAEKEAEIDNIVADISKILELLTTKQSATTAAVVSQKSAEATSPQTTPTPQPKPQDNASQRTKNSGQISPVANSTAVAVEQRPTKIVSAKPAPSNLRENAQKPKTADRVVRVNAENLNRIMGLAGESLVEAKWLQPFADSLLKLRKNQGQLYNLLEKLQESLSDSVLDQRSEDYLGSARKKANDCRHILSDRLNELELFARRSANLSDRLYREVIASNMRPFADGVSAFGRMLRDLARQLGKQVKFEVVGKSTQVDRDILEKLEAPLTHILRNAIDHGIELPDARLAAGKSAEGTIRLEAAHRGGMLSITVSDDGKGIEPEKLRQKIVTKGMVSAEMAAKLTEPELMDFLFLPGFSTASQVTEISGRGVGLDIVQSMVQEVGGILRATSMPEKGMSFHLQLPLTLSVIRTLLVEISGEPYAFPLTRIDRIVMVESADIAIAENRQYFTLDNQNIGLVTAYQVLELAAPPEKLDLLPVIIVSDRSSSYGLAVDKFLGERDLVVRPLDPRLGKVADISAAAFMEDGTPVLIIDVEDLVRSTDKLLAESQLQKVSKTEQTAESTTRKRVLVVDDSITVREVERKLLENQGYEVEIAVNGMDGWNALRTGQFDLVISDVDMPRMTGIELVSQIKNHSALKSIPVIIVSYKDREQDRIRGLEVGADYYLTKSSFHDDTLLNAVVDLIGEA